MQRSVITCEFARAVLDGTRVEGGTCMLAGAASALTFTNITTATLYQLGNANDTDMFSSANVSHKWPRRLPSPLPTVSQPFRLPPLRCTHTAPNLLPRHCRA